MKYRPEIDGLRSVAVLPVIFFHAGIALFSGGYVGVDVFFVISGYLISTIIFERSKKGAFSIVDFYEARARRILPALFFVMIACLPMAWLWMNPDQWREFSESMIWTSLFSSNIFFWLNSDYFASASEFKPLLHTWSLAVEEQYYVFFPLIVMAFWRFGKKVLGGIFVLLGIASFVLCCWLVSRNPEANFFLTPSRVWELLIGVACAAILMKQRSAGTTTSHGLNQSMSALGLAMITYSILFFDHHTPFPSAWALLPVAGTGLIIVFAKGETWVGKLLSLKPLVWIGLISYSAYLWHQPLYAFARIKTIGEPHLNVMLALATLSLLLAWVSWRWVEQPFRKKKTSGKVLDGKKFLSTRKGIFAFSVAGLLAFVGVGYVQAKGIAEPQRLVDAKAMEKQFKRVGGGRGRMVAYEKCHFNPAKNWKGNWNCEPGTGRDKDLAAIGIAVVGDSHAADKSMVLRIMGYSPVQFGGAGCPINPTPNKKHCAELFEFARDKIRDDDSIKELWLVNRYGGNELHLKSLQQALDFWAPTGKQIVFFSQVPEYRNLREQAYLTAPELPEVEAVFDMYDKSMSEEVLDLMASRDIIVIDSARMICERRESCDYKDKDGKLLYIDDSHLTQRGARAAGRRLQRTLNCLTSPSGNYSVLAKPKLCEKRTN
ncbi:MAG: acyltransferase [Hellea sp.]|nr:acyltransferase [Hellea sp.]